MSTFAYTVQQGDTFTSIAKLFNTTVNTLESLNPGVNPDNLQIGQAINVPATGVQITTYTIKQGDTLSSIAPKFNTTVDVLESQNPGINPNNLQVGQVINVRAEELIHYTIKQGDTFSAIANAYKITVDSLEFVNPGVQPTQLSIGQVINVPIPASATSAGAKKN